jgi:hypothetical protein
MKWLAALSLFVFAAPAPEIRYFHFERAIERPAQAAGQTCLVVNPAIFAHASNGLADLRLYDLGQNGSATETPYVLRSAVPAASSSQSLSVLNLGKNGKQTVFDVAMPEGRYNDVRLGIEGQDFLATVTVSGSQSQSAASRTSLGSFTIFDLTRQKLGRSTVLHLPESDFRFLHFQIAGPITPQDVTGVSVTQNPATQPRYVTVAAGAAGLPKGRDTVFELMAPARAPVDRVVFTPGQQPPNFSRDVRITISPTVRPPATDGSEPPEPVTATGSILRVHSVQDGHRIDDEHLTVDAPRAYFDGTATWTVSVENGDDAPLQLVSVQLEMIERDLCFDATPGSVYTLYYGDDALAAPRYDYATLFVADAHAATAQFAAETVNPAYGPRPDERPFTEKHAALLWIALIVVIVLLGAVAVRSVKAKPVNRS